MAAREKMDEEALLALLRAYEDDSAQFVNGPLRTVRDRNVKDYFRRPYGNEEPGWSGYVASDTMDTIEWMLPDLLDQFISNPKAVEFEPTREAEVQGAKQATQAANHVFYQQNPGFWVLMTAFKDALIEKTCAVTWRAETKRRKTRVNMQGISAMELALAEEDGDEVESIERVGSRPLPPTPLLDAMGQPMLDPMTGQPAIDPNAPAEEDLYNVRISRTQEYKCCKVEAFEPQNLGVYRQWTSPYLHDCPYVVRWMEVTLSELNQLAEQLGFDEVEASDLAASQAPAGDMEDQARRDRTGDTLWDRGKRPEGIEGNDESLTMGWLRIEWVLADVDGDGIAERRVVYRLDDKILHEEECSHVPVATGSPIPVAHRWDGMSVAEALSDLQMIHSELMRGVLDNAQASNNPRKVVLTNSDGAPYANIDDLLDSRPGGNIRVTRPDALTLEQTAYVGNQFDPLLQRLDMLREQRTGVTKQRMGMDPNAIAPDRTLGESQMIDTAAKQRVKLIARVFAETIVMPMFRGILKVLTEGGFEPLFFKLAGSEQFVQLDPNEWTDSYNMVPNVGLGTGDDAQKFAILKNVSQDQIMMAQSPLGPQMVTPKQIYNTRARMLELAGIKNIGDYYQDPGEAPLPKKPEGPPPEVMIEQMRLENKLKSLEAEKNFELEKFQITSAQERARQQDQDAVQAANDDRDARREQLKAYYDSEIEAVKLQLEKYKVDQNNMFSVILKKMENPAAQLPEGFHIDAETGMASAQPDRLDAVLQGLNALAEQQDSPAELVRDEYGNPTHVRKGGRERPIVRNPDGSIAGVQ